MYNLLCISYRKTMAENGKFFVVASAIILNDQNQVLLTQRAYDREHHPGGWENQSGRLHQGESVVEGLVREMKEELDIIVEPILPVSTFHFYRGPEKVEHIGIDYICKIKSGKVKVDGKEEIAYQWTDIEKALEIVKDKSIRSVLRLVKDRYIKEA